MPRIAREKLEAAARAYLLEMGYEYTGKSIVSCAESKDRDIYNPRAAKAVQAAQKILRAAA
jgi:hypothetical protein